MALPSEIMRIFEQSTTIYDDELGVLGILSITEIISAIVTAE